MSTLTRTVTGTFLKAGNRVKIFLNSPPSMGVTLEPELIMWLYGKIPKICAILLSPKKVLVLESFAFDMF